MTRQNKVYTVVFFLTMSLLWYLAPSADRLSNKEQARHQEMWKPSEKSPIKDLVEIRDKLVTAPALGYIPSKKEETLTQGRIEENFSFYGVFCTESAAFAIVETDGAMRLLKKGDKLSDGNTLIAVSINDMKTLSGDGIEKTVSLYGESL